ncbi:unnamed protein product [Dovyalis caffra]|uniref:Uncharacterized protein n=1 Tax=Dovyalis caffra TaxID=77055 RepID=A0AAV1RJM6_9ROSI|nr:unnamed protein product [Dovyalis caffra]
MVRPRGPFGFQQNPQQDRLLSIESKMDKFIDTMGSKLTSQEEARREWRRPFLNIDRALMDVYKGGLPLRIGEEQVEFWMSKAMKHPMKKEICLRVDVIEECVVEKEEKKQKEGIFEEEKQMVASVEDERTTPELLMRTNAPTPLSIVKPPTLKLKPLPSHLRKALPCHQEQNHPSRGGRRVNPDKGKRWLPLHHNPTLRLNLVCHSGSTLRKKESMVDLSQKVGLETFIACDLATYEELTWKFYTTLCYDIKNLTSLWFRLFGGFYEVTLDSLNQILKAMGMGYIVIALATHFYIDFSCLTPFVKDFFREDHLRSAEILLIANSSDDVENDAEEEGWRIVLKRMEETNAIYDTRITAMETQIKNLAKFQCVQFEFEMLEWTL